MLTFATALTAAGIDPSAVRLLRHHKVYPGGRTPYSLWRDHREMFEQYQSTQAPERRAYFAAPYWASFVVPPVGDTLFVGLYSAALAGGVPPDMIDPLTGMAPGAGKGRQYDLYNCRRMDAMAEYVGSLSVDWGPGTRSWVQRGNGGEKQIVALSRKLKEERFPGFTRFVTNLSALKARPQGWQEALRSARGITCWHARARGSTTWVRLRARMASSAVGASTWQVGTAVTWGCDCATQAITR